MQKTNIAWTDYSSNPLKYRYLDGTTVWACVHASPGCQHCYSEALALRYNRGRLFNVANMKEVTPFLDEKELHRILTYKPASGKRCFVGDMTDLFGEWVPFELLDKLFAVFALRPDVTFQLLTKRADRMRDYFFRHQPKTGAEDAAKFIINPHIRTKAELRIKDWPLPNVWLGVSVENQQYADERIPLLLQTPAAVRFVSYEPALSYVDFSKWLYNPSHEEQAQRGLCLSSDSEWRSGNPAGRDDMAVTEARMGSLATEGSEPSMPSRKGGTRLRGILPGQNNDRQCASVRAGASASVPTFERADTRGSNHQSPGREEEAKPSGQFRISDTPRAGVSCNTHLGQEPESPSSVWRTQRNGKTDPIAGHRDSSETVSWGKTEINSGRLSDQLSGSIENRSRREMGLHLIIVGGESGPKARPFNTNWARNVVRQCTNSDTAIFVKQIGSKPYACRESSNGKPDHSGCISEGIEDVHSPHGSDMSEWAEDLRIRQYPAITPPEERESRSAAGSGTVQSLT